MPVVMCKAQAPKTESSQAGENKSATRPIDVQCKSAPDESARPELLEAANDAPPKPGETTNNASKPKSYTSLDELSTIGAYRGQVTGLVGKAGQNKCVVLDMGYNTVSILCIPEFAHTGQFAAVRHDIESRALSVANECWVTPELLNQVLTDIHRRSQRAAVTVTNGTSEDMRNLALFIELVAGAWKLEATDIHVVLVGRTSSTSLVRLRISGRMSDWKSFPSKTLLAALAAGYSSLSVAGTNSDPDWAPSKACSTITHHEVVGADGRRRSISGRFTSRPTVDSGCKVAIRLLDTDVRDVRIPILTELGYEHSHVEEQLNPALQKNQGMILVAGGTGSGKSTTLRTLMHILPDKESLERYSVEDPVEYVLPGVIQLSVQRGSDESEEKTRLKFTAALRDLMRMDPDVVMIGEIRDGETARLATEMVNTGHRVLSTVHGNGNIDVLDRLTGPTLGVSSSTLASSTFLLCVVYQKLLPKLCPSCKRPAKAWLTPQQLKAVVQRFGLDPATLFVAKPDGCDDCNLPEIAPSGTSGQTVVAEVMTTDRQILDLIRESRWNDARDYWRRQRRTPFGDPDMTGKTAFEHAIYKMSRGLVSIHDIERDFEPLATYPLMEMENPRGLD